MTSQMTWATAPPMQCEQAKGRELGAELRRQISTRSAKERAALQQVEAAAQAIGAQLQQLVQHERDKLEARVFSEVHRSCGCHASNDT